MAIYMATYDRGAGGTCSAIVVPYGFACLFLLACRGASIVRFTLNGKTHR